MRVYLPATFATLHQLADDGKFPARSAVAFAVTDALRSSFDEGDEEEFDHYAFQDAALASLRLLSAGDPHFPHRRVVISADIPDEQATLDEVAGDTVVRLDPALVEFDQVAAIHVDLGDYEEATAKAVAAIDAADLGDEDAELAVGDALDNFMAWYDPLELNLLTQ